MDCILLSKFDEVLLGSALQSVTKRDFNKAVIIPFADDKNAITHLYNKKYDKNKMQLHIINAQKVLRCLFGEKIIIDVLAETREAEELICEADIVIILGGHPVTCMNKIDNLSLTDAFGKEDTLYIGVSAGAKVLCEWFLSINDNKEEKLFKGLGIVEGLVLFVHYRGTEMKHSQQKLCGSINVKKLGIPDDGFICHSGMKGIVMKNIIEL